MINKLFILIACALLPFFGCSQKSGEVKIHKDVQGTNAKVGDFMILNFQFKTDKDSVLRDTYKEGVPITITLQESTYKGSLEEGLSKLSAGDSATLSINADSLFAKSIGAPRPEYIKAGSNVKFIIKVNKVLTKEEMMKEQEKMAAEQKAKDDQIIQEYIKANNLKAEKTPSGLYYVKVKEGKGAKAEPGKMVSVHYTGKLTNGNVFDSSVNRGTPFEFPLGAGNVIRGWDEGIALMKVGEKGTLLIPSYLAYGERGAPGAIPPNSVLIFDVELLGVK